MLRSETTVKPPLWGLQACLYARLVGGNISPVYYSMNKRGPGFNAHLLKDILDMLFDRYF